MSTQLSKTGIPTWPHLFIPARYCERCEKLWSPKKSFSDHRGSHCPHCGKVDKIWFVYGTTPPPKTIKKMIKSF